MKAASGSSMAMVRVALTMIVLILVSATSTTKKCGVQLRHYNELDCKPVFGNGTSGCPERYDCSSMLGRNTDKCYFKSKEYNMLEDLDSTNYDCYCDKIDKGRVGFICYGTECSNDQSKLCLYQYAAPEDPCVSTMVCDLEEIITLTSCYHGNEIYKEGEKIHDQDSCKTCLCGKGFDGTLESLQCIEQSCRIELDYGYVFEEGCAPTYQNNSCCPINWICPESEVEKKAIKVRGNYLEESDDPNMKCRYGRHLLDVGEEVIMDDDCVNCKCVVPPMVSCIKRC